MHSLAILCLEKGVHLTTMLGQKYMQITNDLKLDSVVYATGMRLLNNRGTQRE